MPTCSPSGAVLAMALLTASTAGGLQIRGYSGSESRYDRFTNFPTAPVLNAASFFDGSRFHGVGWQVTGVDRQVTLVTRSHVLGAFHFLPPMGSQIRFLSESGNLVDRTVVAIVAVDNDNGTPSDLALITLDAPIEASEGVDPTPYLDLFSTTSYLSRTATVFGRRARGGTGVYASFANVSSEDLNPSFAIAYNQDLTSGDADDAWLEGGDSGSPQFLTFLGDTGLVGINLAINTNGNVQSNFASFVPAYVDELDQQLASEGYRMRPARTGTTTMASTHSLLTTTPRQGNPLEIEVTIENTGNRVTGNLEAAFQFGGGEAPDSIVGADWIPYANLPDAPVPRRARLDDGETTTVTLSWTTAPLVEDLTWTMTGRSDKAADTFTGGTVALGPSFAAWADGLTLAGPLDDPDLDGVPNLLEYAFGSDPEEGQPGLPNGEPSRPVLGSSGTTIHLSFPERDDAAARGLAYQAEWSDDPAAASFSTTPPAGLSSATAAYDPPLAGFVKRTLSWPDDGVTRFARVGVTLSE